MNRVFGAFLMIVTFALAATAEDTPFRQATGDYRLSYPRDHGAHPDFATEWWYVTGHLTAENGGRYGFEVVFFRIGVNQAPELRSAWKMDSFYFAHFAVTDDKSARYHQFKRRSRGSFAQASASTDGLDVWLRDWKLALKDDVMTLAAAQDNVALELALRPKKPLVLQGENGFSKKGPGSGDASYYSSFSRLEGDGRLTIDGRSEKITRASAWFDHEFTSSKLARGTEGWDWFAIQLDNGEELMVYQLRTESGEASEYSSGTWVDADGRATHLKRDEFAIEPLAFWTSGRTGVKYPGKWKVSVPAKTFTALVTPTVADQELVTESSAGVTYWEGRSIVEAEKAGQQLGGNAYVELVGYK